MYLEVYQARTTLLHSGVLNTANHVPDNSKTSRPVVTKVFQRDQDKVMYEVHSQKVMRVKSLGLYVKNNCFFSLVK